MSEYVCHKYLTEVAPPGDHLARMMDSMKKIEEKEQDAQNLESFPLAKLQDICRSEHIVGCSLKDKNELIKRIRNHRKSKRTERSDDYAFIGIHKVHKSRVCKLCNGKNQNSNCSRCKGVGYLGSFLSCSEKAPPSMMKKNL